MKEYKLNANSVSLDDTSSFENRIKKHQKRLYIVGSIMIAGSLALFGYKKYTEINSNHLQEDLFEAVFAFEKDDFSTAIYGTEDFLGLESLAKKYSSAKESKLINFYLGISYLKTQKYEEAISSLTIAIGIDDKIISARACGLVGDCYTELDNIDKAVEFFNKAANMNPCKETSPTFLLKIASIYECNGDIEKALSIYKGIQENYQDFRKEFIAKNIYRLQS